MSPNVRLRQRMRVLLNMVTALVVVILLAQLWLFTVTIDAMETRKVSAQIVIVGLTCSLLGCGAVWALIRFFARIERDQL
jgi:fucose 4-O-acetylase-like acetyltransferase